MTIEPCEHNNLSIYEPISMKLFMQANMHKISDEFDIEADSIINNRVMALCRFMTVEPCEHNNLSIY